MEDQGPVHVGQAQDTAGGTVADPAASPSQRKPSKPTEKAKGPQSKAAAPAQQPPGRRKTMYKDFVFKPKTAHAVWKRPIALQSHSAQKVYEGCWQAVQDTFFYMDVILGWQADLGNEALSALFDVLEKRFEELERDMETETKRLRHISESIGSRTTVAYENVFKASLSVYSPSAGRYAELVEKMDEMIGWLDSLWFAGRISPKDRITACRNWTVRMRRFNREAHQVAIRARACVQRRETDRRGGGADDLDAAKAKQRALAAAAAALRGGGKGAKEPPKVKPAAAAAA